MRHRYPVRLVALLAALIVAVACGSQSLPVATPQDAARAQERWPGTTMADLERGRVLYRGRCANCHQPVPPDHVRASDWPARVSEMKARAGLRDDEASLVVRYLVTMAERRTAATVTPAR